MPVSFPLAIIGAACRMPGGTGLEAFGEFLLAGRDAVGEVPDERWTKARYFHPVPGQPGKTYSFAAGCVSDIYAFDAGFFGISPREAQSIDPQQRLMLELTYEAIEDAGLLPSKLAGQHVGVYVGASAWDFAAASFSDAAGLDSYAMQGAALSSTANRISYVFDLHGPSFTVDTACSSSLVALHQACTALRRGEIGMAIVGGVNLLLAPQAFVGFARASMLSRSGRCHPFDARADGYARAEGGGAIIIKPLPQALADGDEIHAVILGTGVNSDGRTSGLAMPNRDAQAALLRQVYNESDVAPDELAYFEAHGTGTPVGDPIEAHAIGEALARHRRTRLPIGSVKSNIGHLEPASGMAGLMKLIVAFAHRVVPATLNFATPNPHIPLDALNLDVVAAPRVLPPVGQTVVAGINSFGFGGTNAHAILASPPVRTAPHADSGRSMPLLLSARSTDALRALAAAWRDRLLRTAAEDVPPLLRAAARHREHYPHRMVVNAPAAAELAEFLEAWLADRQPAEVVTGQVVAGGLCFVFSGNGSQWAGMALDALALSPAFGEALAEVDALLAPELGWSVVTRLAEAELATSLRDTSVAQPLLFAIQVATVRVLGQLGVQHAACIGHSAGEVAAAWASGALTLPQACHVIVQRSLLQRITHGLGLMAALAAEPAEAASLIAAIDPELTIGAVNAARAVTVAGPTAAVEQLIAVAAAEGLSCTRLDLDYAFHSGLMDPVRAPLLRALEGLQSASPAIPMISTVTGTAVAEGELGADYWWRNVRLPVRFHDAVEVLLQSGFRNFVEIGPQPVLLAYLRDAIRGASPKGQSFGVLSRRKPTTDPFAAAAAKCHVAGASLAGSALFDGFADLRGIPGYQWQRRRFGITRSSEAIEAANPRHDHPLLGFRDPQSQDGWMSHLSLATEPWLADHVVNGTVILPAAAMIDMALAVARVRYGDTAALELQDLEIARPMPLDATAIRDCRTTVTPDGQLSMASRPRLADEPMQTHLACRIMPGLSDRPILPEISGADEEVTEADAFYASAAKVHLDYGPAFRTVAQVRRRDADTGIVVLCPPETDRRTAGYLLDPALLDGCLQGVLVLVAEHTHLAKHGAMVPWRFGRIRLLRPHDTRLAQAAVRIRDVGPRSIRADITLLAADAAVVAELSDCWFVTMPGAGQAPADQTFWTAYVPSARQPEPSGQLSVTRALAAVPGVAEPSASALLADGFVLAAAFETLRARADAADGVLPAETAAQPLATAALRWLADEGLATHTANGWQLGTASDLPAATDIWRSLFVETPQAVAEYAVLASLGPAIADNSPAALQLSTVLKEQLLYASPSANLAAEALLHAIGTVTATWPAQHCLRIAMTGVLPVPLLRRVVDRMAACGIPLRLVAWAKEVETLGAVQDIAATTPGIAVRSWGSLTAADRGSFDIVINLYGLSLTGSGHAGADLLGALVARGGLLLDVEPVESRGATLLFGPALDPAAVPTLRQPEDWCAALDAAGFANSRHVPLGGAIWPVALIAAASPSAGQLPAAPQLDADLIVFAAPDDPVAGALAARQGVLRLLPIEAMRDALSSPFAARLRHVLLLAANSVEEDGDADALAELLAEVSAALMTMPGSEAPRLWLVSPGSPTTSGLPAALTGLRRVAANELPGLDCRAVCLDADLPAAEAAERLLQEITDPDEEREVHWQPGGRLVPRLRSGLPRPASIGGPRLLEIGRPGLVGSLAWVPAAPPALDADSVAVEVRATALNFRDVMWAQGLLPDEALLAGFSGAGLGLECAGVVTAVGPAVSDLRPGDRVMAVAPAALATHAVTHRNGVMRIPPELDFAAAATMPVAFMTAVYALGTLGRLRPGERVLIHAGAGGVGLAAIQYALHKGAVVYATAGSSLRRQLLRMLGATAVFDSRSARFADDLLAATNGEGVDVVLNSLSQELMQQSVRLLRPFGRFLEIGKRDLYRNTPLGIRPLRHNASYFAIDVDELVAQRPDTAQALLAEIADLLEEGRLHPLPYRAFGFADVVSAFRLLQSSGHVGKVVLLPEPTPQPAARASFAADPDGVYLVTGGLSGFGLEAARWLGRQGARKLALLGRRGADTVGSEAAIAGFAADGIAATPFACDVADPCALEPVLAEIRRSMGPIRGVLHAAMTLDDAHLQDMDASRFATVIRPKLAGAQALDRLTRDDPVDLFVLFSSITSVIGTPGQANYIAANAAMETLAVRRRAEGLPALAVQWGPIADAGYLTREQRVGEMLAKMLGSRHLPAAQALDSLPALLQSGRAVIGLADVAWGEVRHRLPGLASRYWSEMPVFERHGEGGESIRTRLADLPPDQAARLVLEIIVAELAAILQQPPASIDVDRPLQEFGVDSLMAVELQMALEGRLDMQLPVASLTGAPNLRGIATRLLQAMRNAQATQADEISAALLRYENTTLPAAAAEAAAEPVR